LLLADEIGHLPVTQSGGASSCNSLAGATATPRPVLTSITGFEEWGCILSDELTAATLLNRLLHRCHILNIRGNSYRMCRPSPSAEQPSNVDILRVS